MATIGNINVGMSLDAVDFNRGMGHARVEVRSFASDVDRMGGLLKGALAGVAVGGVVHGLVSMAKAAAHVEEGVNSLGIVFGSRAGEMEQYVRSMADAFNVGVSGLLDRSNEIGSIFQGVGFGEDQVARFTRSITQAAVDMSRFKDVPFAVALEKMRAALAGEYIPLRSFGILMSEAAVSAEGMRLGLAGVDGELDELAKMQARASLILKGSAPAMGTAAREAEGAAAQIEGFAGAWENFTVKVGETFAPVVGKTLGEATALLKAMHQAWGDNEETSMGWLTELSTELGVATAGMGTLAEAVGLVSDAGWEVHRSFTAWTSGGLALMSGAARGLSGLIGDPDERIVGGVAKQLGWGQNLRLWADELDGRVRKMDDADVAMQARGKPSDRLEKMLKDQERRIKELREKLSKPEPEEKPAESSSTDLGKLGKGQFQAMAGAGFAGFGGFAGLGGIGAAAAVVAGAAAREAIGDPKKWGGPERQFAGAMAEGSVAAVETILRTKYGGRTDAVAENTRRAADVLERIEGKMERNGFRVGADPRREPFEI